MAGRRVEQCGVRRTVRRAVSIWVPHVRDECVHWGECVVSCQLMLNLSSRLVLRCVPVLADLFVTQLADGIMGLSQGTVVLD